MEKKTLIPHSPHLELELAPYVVKTQTESVLKLISVSDCKECEVSVLKGQSSLCRAV